MSWLLPASELAELDAPEAGASFGTGLKARILATLFTAGGTLVAVEIALPHSAQANVPAALVIVTLAYGVAGLLHWGADRLQPSLLPVALGCGLTLITGVAYFS